MSQDEPKIQCRLRDGIVQVEIPSKATLGFGTHCCILAEMSLIDAYELQRWLGLELVDIEDEHGRLIYAPD